MVLYIQHRISPFLPSLGVFEDLQIGILSAMRKTSYQEEFHADKPDALSLLLLFLQKVRLNHRFSLFRRRSFQAHIEKIIVRQKHRGSHGGGIYVRRTHDYQRNF